MFYVTENLPTRFCVLPCGGEGVDSDTFWNDLHTPQAARMVRINCLLYPGTLC